MIEHALALAARGFHVFPVKAGAKTPPLIKDFPTLASLDQPTITKWWTQWPDANIGISTSKFGDSEALLVLDVDNKGNQYGNESILKLELEGCELPDTYVQDTPTGGYHFVYRLPRAVRQSVGKIGKGLDVRSRGGYILAAGSRLPDGVYRAGEGRVGSVPTWLVRRCIGETDGVGSAERLGAGVADTAAPITQGTGVESAAAGGRTAGAIRKEAIRRAREYLTNKAPAAEGERNDAAFKTAARLRDFGVDQPVCAALMAELWKCEPALDRSELEHCVNSAYTYAKDIFGSATAEAAFPPDHPFAQLNKKYAYLVKGDTVLFETQDEKGRQVTDHMTVAGFNRTHAAWKMAIGKRSEPVTVLWMEHPSRRTYQRIVFAPKGDAAPEFYNLWRGFSVEPAASSDHPAVKQWLEHCLKNICQNDATLHAWLVGYFAHMVQRPWEKPLVALVFKGGKGVGKNALVGAIGALLGGHYLLSSNRRYLVGQFNGHLENLLLFVLDEAFWSGDKQAEGTLKDLITGLSHVIEHKGKEPYAVDNLCRVAIIGNEGWLVPASHDERRFAVFNVGSARKQDRPYFSELARGMEGGGASALLRYLLDFDISTVDVNGAPASAGLLDQKNASLEPFSKWWLACLQDGMIHGSEFGTEWPEKIDAARFTTAYRTWMREQNISVRLPNHIVKALHVFAPGVVYKKARFPGGNTSVYGYHPPTLEQARAEWAKHMGQAVVWE